MTPIIIIAIGLLGTIFMASFVALLIVCKHKHSGRADFTVHQNEEKQDVELIAAKDAADVDLSPSFPNEELPELLDLDSCWSDNSENLIAECVTLLKTCHQLTERLVAFTMENVIKLNSQEKKAEIVAAARDIGLKVDDVVNSMYVPSDFDQIKKKSTVLYESVCKLLEVIKKSTRKATSLGWADEMVTSLGWADEMVTSIRKHIELMDSNGKTSWEDTILAQSPTKTVNHLNKPVVSSFTNRAYCS